MFIGILVIAIVIYLLYNKNTTVSFARDSNTSDAQYIIKERLAKGEIDEKTYDNLLRKIMER